MPSYITNPQPVQLNALYPGNHEALVNNAAVDSGVTKTKQLAIGPVPNQSGATILITNSTNQDANGQYAAQDPTPAGVAATYEPLSGCIIPAGSSLAYNLSVGWITFTFSVAPTSGSLIVSR